ncbi:DUF6705 family protein [uncultured Mesonia sp.]|uniref:DUF6705 family protein n=1 Tax=uncultured Mesonia sp. TaxID=399731 RepID=UPI00374E2388
MKTYLITLISLFFALNTWAQLQTVNMNTRDNSQDHSGKYYKDIDDNFDPFIGVWQGTHQNTTMIIDISKAVLGPSPSNNYAQDFLVIDIQLIEGMGTPMEMVICNTAAAYSHFDKLIRSITHATTYDGVTMSGFLDDNCHPGNSAGGIVVMNIQNPQASPLTATWEIEKKGIVAKTYPGEPDFVIPTSIVLTKQP